MVVILKGWRTGDEIQGYVEPGAAGNREGLEESCRRLVHRLVLVVHTASFHKVFNILVQRGPPESLMKQLPGPKTAKMVSQFRQVAPFQ